MSGLNPAVPLVLGLITFGLASAGLYAKYKLRQIDRRIAESEALDMARRPPSPAQ